MAALVINVADVGMTTTKPRTQRVVFGEIVTEGVLVYKKADGKYYKALADNVDATLAVIAGVTLNPAAANDYGDIAISGVYDCGATVVVGRFYALSAAAAGIIVPLADIVATNNVSVLGYGATTSTIKVDINNTGLVLGA